MITVVSGLPRSGTSLMMQMLAAGGMPTLTDGIRTSDVNNPRGYFEWERIKKLPQETAIIAEAEGKAVKIVSALLRNLPAGYDYRIIFMRRSLEEVAASQAEMLKQSGASSAPAQGASMKAALQTHVNQVLAWLESQQDLPYVQIQHRSVIGSPQLEAARIREFLGFPLDVSAMTQQVDVSLHRQRATESDGNTAAVSC